MRARHVREGQRTPASAASVAAAVRTHFSQDRIDPALYRDKITNDLFPDPDDRVHAAAAIHGEVDPAHPEPEAPSHRAGPGRRRQGHHLRRVPLRTAHPPTPRRPRVIHPRGGRQAQPTDDRSTNWQTGSPPRGRHASPNAFGCTSPPDRTREHSAVIPTAPRQPPQPRPAPRPAEPQLDGATNGIDGEAGHSESFKGALPAVRGKQRGEFGCFGQAILGPLLVMATLAGIYPTVLNLLGIPWWALGVSLAGIALASTLVVRALHRKEAPVTL